MVVVMNEGLARQVGKSNERGKEGLVVLVLVGIVRNVG
jgi:hypothetical protein